MACICKCGRPVDCGDTLCPICETEEDIDPDNLRE